MPITMLTPKPKLSTVLFESRRVIKSQPRRGFVALALAFLLPLSVTAVVSQNNFLIINGGTTSLGPDHPDQDRLITIPSIATLLVSLGYSLFILVFSPCANGSITFAAFRAFHGEPVEARTAVKSISASFFPLLATDLLVRALVLAVAMAFAMLFASVVGGAWLLGFPVEPGSPYFIGFSIAIVVSMTLVMIHLHVSWALASAVVVVESTWGFEALSRSSSLVKGKRFLTFILSLVFGVLYCVLGWKTNYSNLVAHLKDSAEKECVSILLACVVQVVVVSCFRTLVRLYEIVATTVLYVCCRAIHEEESFGYQYVGLPLDDGKVAGGVVYVDKFEAYGY